MPAIDCSMALSWMTSSGCSVIIGVPSCWRASFMAGIGEPKLRSSGLVGKGKLTTTCGVWLGPIVASAVDAEISRNAERVAEWLQATRKVTGKAEPSSITPKKYIRFSTGDRLEVFRPKHMRLLTLLQVGKMIRHVLHCGHCNMPAIILDVVKYLLPFQAHETTQGTPEGYLVLRHMLPDHMVFHTALYVDCSNPVLATWHTLVSHSSMSGLLNPLLVDTCHNKTINELLQGFWNRWQNKHIFSIVWRPSLGGSVGCASDWWSGGGGSTPAGSAIFFHGDFSMTYFPRTLSFEGKTLTNEKGWSWLRFSHQLIKNEWNKDYFRTMN